MEWYNYLVVIEMIPLKKSPQTIIASCDLYEVRTTRNDSAIVCELVTNCI